MDPSIPTALYEDGPGQCYLLEHIVESVGLVPIGFYWDPVAFVCWSVESCLFDAKGSMLTHGQVCCDELSNLFDSIRFFRDRAGIIYTSVGAMDSYWDPVV